MRQLELFGWDGVALALAGTRAVIAVLATLFGTTSAPQVLESRQMAELLLGLPIWLALRVSRLDAIAPVGAYAVEIAIRVPTSLAIV